MGNKNKIEDVFVLLFSSLRFATVFDINMRPPPHGGSTASVLLHNLVDNSSLEEFPLGVL